ncbi:MAG: FUSC family protein, partial [Sphingobium sp.]|nr:FUSC family protein [Sphingobium sp.]
ADLRIGRNIIPIRRALSHVPHNVRHRLGAVLAVLAVFYGDRWRHGHADAPPPGLLDPIDRALEALLSLPLDEHRRPALRALVGMRCNLFPTAAAPHIVSSRAGESA